MTCEERRAKDREYHRKRYEVKKEEIRQKNLEHYYKKKESDPTFHNKSIGRPRKD